MRFSVEPRDIPPDIAARRLGLTPDQFHEKLPALLQRGFPAADQTTGNFCLEAIDQWRMRRPCTGPDLSSGWEWILPDDQQSLKT